jgi:hypothetical protein
LVWVEEEEQEGERSDLSSFLFFEIRLVSVEEEEEEGERSDS